MKIRIALVALLVVLIPVGMAMAQTPTNLYAGRVTRLLDKANVQQLKSMPGPFTVFAPTDAELSPVCPQKP